MIFFCSEALFMSLALCCFSNLPGLLQNASVPANSAQSAMSHSRLKLGVLIPLRDDSASDHQCRSIALYEGFNTIGRNDLLVADKQVSRKQISIRATANTVFQLTVEGQNPVVLRMGAESCELPSQTKALLSFGDIIELLPGKHSFKLMAAPHETLEAEKSVEESGLLIKRKRQEIEDEALAKALQAIEDEPTRDACITYSSEMEKEVTANSDREIQDKPAEGVDKKVYSTAYIEGHDASTFQLLRVQRLPNWANAGCVGIQDVIRGNVLFALLSNYMVDIDWLLSACPVLRQVPHVVIVHGESGGSLDRLKAEKPSGWLLHKPPLPLSYGTHHSKAMIIVYSMGVRVVVHTANLIYVDWNNKTQGLWMQDFPYKTDTTKRAASPFENDLVDYLEALQWSGCRVTLPHHGNISVNASFFRQFDYSSAQVRLIASVPGYHQGPKFKKWGHMKLRSILEHQSFDEKFIKSPLVYQFSSLGSLDEKWLAEFNSSLSMGSTIDNTPLGQGSFQIVWPTVEDVRSSIEGYAAGNAIPSPLKNVEKDFLRKYWAHWEADHTGRSQAMPHFKSFVRYNGQNLAWFLLTSANLSKAAWGALQKNGSQLMIRSYELGVIFLPSLKTTGSDFSCTDDKAEKVLGAAENLRGAIEETGSNNNKTNVKFVTSCWQSERDHEKHSNIVRFPVPYRLPPKKYDSQDIPWSWDRQYSHPDTYGLLWPRSVQLYGCKDS